MAKIKNFEEEVKMPYITSAERIGRQEGRQEGLQEGKHQTLQRIVQKQLLKKFGVSPEKINEDFFNSSSAELEEILDKILTAKNYEELIS